MLFIIHSVILIAGWVVSSVLALIIAVVVLIGFIVCGYFWKKDKKHPITSDIQMASPSILFIIINIMINTTAECVECC